MKKLFIIHYTCEVEQFGPEGEEYTVERDFTRRYTSYTEAQQALSDLDMIGASRVDMEEYSYFKCLLYYFRAMFVAFTGGYKTLEGMDHFYDLMLKTHFEVGNNHLAEWFDDHSYSWDHRDEPKIYVLYYHHREVGVSKTLRGILQAWWSEFFWNHRITRIHITHGDDNWFTILLGCALEEE